MLSLNIPGCNSTVEAHKLDCRDLYNCDACVVAFDNDQCYMTASVRFTKYFIISICPYLRHTTPLFTSDSLL